MDLICNPVSDLNVGTGYLQLTIRNLPYLKKKKKFTNFFYQDITKTLDPGVTNPEPEPREVECKLTHQQWQWSDDAWEPTGSQAGSTHN